MGALLSFLWGGGKATPALPEVPDPVTGLTPREKDFVVTTWGSVRKDITNNGVQLFLRFFDKLPSAQKRFPSFADMPRDELATSKRLKAHANSVMYSIDSIVCNLDDPEVLEEMLLKIGNNHGRRKVPEDEFKVLKDVLMQLLRDALDIHKSPVGEQAWSKAIDVMYKGIFKGMAETRDK
ncbi:globin C, coelomic-like isoform X3 [Schistocerca nitens]|nr:globin C, coelomic-like isoform X3 [Schistocerca nitens]